MIRPAKGTFLIAEPFLGDANFERSVVLLCEHNHLGSFGFVMNQATNLQLNDVLKDAVASDFPLYVGGPVDHNTLHYIHRIENVEDSVRIADGLYWSGDFEQITNMLNLGQLTEQDIRFFVGYSGWSQGQLESEMMRNSWMVAPATASFMFDTAPDQFWRTILRRMGGEYKVKSNYPIDPSLN
jgi:putative transcriptional regulator